MKNLISTILLLLIALSVSNCNKDGAREFTLLIDYWNPNGNNPQISFDAGSSPEIRIDFNQTFAGVALPPNLINVIIDNVRIIGLDNNANYKIDEIVAYEFRDDINNWKEDVEFVMEYAPIENLKVMLILDASASLGADFGTIKTYADDFITRILTETPTAEIGIIDFSDVINSFGLTSNQGSLSSYIAAIQQGPFTTLYGAMDRGIDSLQNNFAEGKAILTFTDGTDNNSDPQFTPGYLYDKLTNDPNYIKINSFAIGLEGNGGVDKPVLQNLAANGGVVEFPETIDQLSDVFVRFSKAISNVYNLKYIRNQQIIPFASAVKLKFVITAHPK